MTIYLEHQKMKAVQEKSQTIGEFLNWLMYEKHLVICERTDPNLMDNYGNQSYIPLMHGSYSLIEELLAQFFDIDLKKIAQEKESIYQELVNAVTAESLNKGQTREEK